MCMDIGHVLRSSQNLAVLYSYCNSFFICRVHRESGLINMHLFDILPAFCLEKSGIFFRLASGNSVYTVRNYYASLLGWMCLKHFPERYGVQQTHRTCAPVAETQTLAVWQSWMAVCPNFTLQMMIQSSGWQTLEGELAHRRWRRVYLIILTNHSVVSSFLKPP